MCPARPDSDAMCSEQSRLRAKSDAIRTCLTYFDTPSRLIGRQPDGKVALDRKLFATNTNIQHLTPAFVFCISLVSPGGSFIYSSRLFSRICLFDYLNRLVEWTRRLSSLYHLVIQGWQ